MDVVGEGVKVAVGVGLDVGDMVGESEGVVLGVTVGEMVGLLLGVPEGLRVGLEEGVPDGVRVMVMLWPGCHSSHGMAWGRGRREVWEGMPPSRSFHGCLSTLQW